MRTLFTILFMAAFFFNLEAQTNCAIKKAYAFYTVSTPGMQMSDENGNPITPKTDIARFIYIECCGKAKPELETVLYNNVELNATLTPITGKSVIPGDNPENNASFKITAKNANRLWRIDLHAPAGKEMPVPDCKNIYINTRVKSKTCTLKLEKETLLASMPRY
ncbi:MAG TPA: hypothetical protein PKY28_09125 [Ferruginibacter sp.]|nr:hypothetical protein [Ferruginibacter sp.]